ncbi:TetR/AcrR family transcriptional regulator [Streptomyces flavochromogenes]|uniref:TetR/AcrR family transcriptional regulator n=1 Tax=Streptomyces flavochromogenes TaxID=68199 RepID=A0ABW6XRP2_9ACTN|nr:TetR/AcrR family transcriptional regulator [Streptomyces flavochromogenes]
MARVKAILDAAEEILAESGYEAATLKAIAERAGIPTPSVYHYFNDRYQVDAAIVRHHSDALLGVLDGIDGEEFRSISDVVRLVFDPIVAYFRAHPSCVQLWFSGRHAALSDQFQEFDDQVAERLWRLGIGRGLLRVDTPPLVMKLAFEAGGRLFDVAFQKDRNGDQTTMTEAKRMVTAYLETYAEKSTAHRAD